MKQEITTVVATGDLHFDTTSRWDECVRIHNWMTDDWTKRNADLVVVPGDWYERLSKPEERRAVKNLLKKTLARRPLVGVRGNHDAVLDLDVFTDVGIGHWPIVIEEAWSVRLVDAGHSDDPFDGAITRKVAVALVAWPRKAQLLSLLKSEVSHEQSEIAVREQLRLLMLNIREELAKHPGPRILAMHAMVRGSMTSVGQPLTGCDLEVSLEELALTEADIIFLSHVHKPQEWSVNGIPIIYCGSPYATAYGELEEKSYAVAEFNERRDANGKILKKWYRVPTPRTPMLLVNARYMPETNGFYYQDEPVFQYSMVAGADVRFRYTVDSDYVEAAEAAARILENDLRREGAVQLKIESVINATTRARAPEVVTAQSFPDKLKVLWSSKAIEVDEARQARLVAKVIQLEAEIRAGQ